MPSVHPSFFKVWYNKSNPTPKFPLLLHDSFAQPAPICLKNPKTVSRTTTRTSCSPQSSEANYLSHRERNSSLPSNWNFRKSRKEMNTAPAPTQEKRAIASFGKCPPHKNMPNNRVTGNTCYASFTKNQESHNSRFNLQGRSGNRISNLSSSRATGRREATQNTSSVRDCIR